MSVLSRSAAAFSSNVILKGALETYTKFSMHLLEDGVDVSAFKFFRRRSREDHKVTLGWVGNLNIPSGRVKNFELASALEKNFESSVSLKMADGSIPFGEMPAWYQGIDIFLCTSLSEGTPNPFLECLSTGATYLASSVGIIPEFHSLSEGRGGVVVPTIDLPIFSVGLASLLKRRSHFVEMGRLNRKIITDYWTNEQTLKPLLDVLRVFC